MDLDFIKIFFVFFYYMFTVQSLHAYYKPYFKVFLWAIKWGSVKAFMGLFVMHSQPYKDCEDISTMHERVYIRQQQQQLRFYTYTETIIRVFPFKNMNTEGCDNQPERVLLDRVIVQRKCKKDRFI